MKKVLRFAFQAGILFFPMSFSLAVPHGLNIQGRLGDEKGNPVTQARQVDFAIFQGGTAEEVDTGRIVYKERAVVVPNAEGVYSHEIGSGSPLEGHTLTADDFLIDQPVYLQITMQGGATLLPRLKFVAESYAFVSERAEVAEAVKAGGLTRESVNFPSFQAPGAGLLPQGGIILFIDRTACPAGFSEVTTLRNRFPIGADLENQDSLIPDAPGRIIGVRTHTHSTAHAHTLGRPEDFADYETIVFGTAENAPGFGAPKLIKSATVAGGLLRLHGYGHTHAVAAPDVIQSGPADNLPPSLTVLFCAKD